MKINDYHYLKSFTVPDSWQQVDAFENEFNTETLLAFSPKKNPEVRLELYYRGFPLSPTGSKAFRDALVKSPVLLFDENKKNNLLSRELKSIVSLQEVLGNVGNNQLANKYTGIQGPCFYLVRLESLIWKEMPVLAARGYFKDPEDGKRGAEFCGFYIDAIRQAPICRAEEIYLQAPTEELQLKYIPDFQQSLASIEWLDKEQEQAKID